MGSVSCRALEPLFAELSRRRVSFNFLINGTSLSVEHLKNKKARLSWADYAKVLENAQGLFSETDFTTMGGAFTRARVARFMVIIGRSLFSVEDFYKWMATRAGTQLFDCVSGKFERIENGLFHITLSIAPGNQPVLPFFLLTKGSLVSIPKLFGLRAATVSMTVQDNSCTYEVACSSYRTLTSRIRRAIFWTLSARAAATELKEAHESLQDRYRELDAAKIKIDQQAVQLRTAYEITSVIHREASIEPTLDHICKALVEIGGFARAETSIHGVVEDGLKISASSVEGIAPNGVEPLEHPLMLREQPWGALRVWPKDNQNRNERAELLGMVVPALCMAIDDAITFYTVNDYKNNLEIKVRTRTRELEDARDGLAKSVAELSATQAAKQRLFSNINHDIRNPLHLMTLAMGMIRQHSAEKIDDKGKHYLDTIDTSIGRMLKLVDGLMALASQEEQKLRVAPQPGDIAKVVRQTTSAFATGATGVGVNMSYSGPEELPCIVDITAVERVLANLLSNAIKYTRTGGEVRVQLQKVDTKLRITVQDTGAGMEDEFLKRIFGRFEQGSAPVRESGGSSGLGLSIVKDLTKSMGGDVKVESRVGSGSIFTIDLPYLPIPPEDHFARTIEATTTPAQIDALAGQPQSFERFPVTAAKAVVLVAEDDPKLLDYVAGILFDAGYAVLGASDGVVALDHLKNHVPDILVSDVQMPRMNGLDLSQRFRATTSNRLAPVILLTALSDTQAKMEGFKAGAIDYVTKPFEKNELLARVGSQLELRNLATRLADSEKLASMGVLSAGLAHEIRNPANAVVNALEPLRDRLGDALVPGSTAADLMQIVQDAAEQIAVLSSHLLQFNNRGEPTLAPTSAEALVERALILVRPHIQGKRVKIEKRIEYSSSFACAAPLFTQVLTNLIENAIHAIRAEGEILLHVYKQNGQLLFDVRDNGPGIPLHLRDRIFDPFFTTKEPGKGTGLGLSTAKKIVEQHKGTLKLIESSTGAVFQVALPLSLGVEAQNKAAAKLSVNEGTIV